MSTFDPLRRPGQAHMVDVSAKAMTHRIAVAQGRIEMQAPTLAMVAAATPKKAMCWALRASRGIQAAKKTSDLIPLCHPVALTRVALEFAVVDASAGPCPHVVCTATAETVGPTGVEMEALTAVQIALLTIYDMCKAVDRGMVIADVRLLEKHGGKSGSFVRPLTADC